MLGRDYLASPSWALTLSPKLLSSTTAVAAWLAVNEGPSNTGQTFDRSMSAYWQLPEGMASSRRDVQQPSLVNAKLTGVNTLTMGLLTMVKPVKVPASGPPLVQLQLPWLPLLQGLSLSWHEVQPPAVTSTSDTSSSSGTSSTCWRPSVIFTDSTGIEHVVTNQTTVPLAEVGPGYTLGNPSDTSWSHQFQFQRASVLLLRDPRCSYSLQLTWDLLGSVPVILLAHGSAVAALLMSMLLLVLSHQMAVLIRLVDVARHGGGGSSSVSVTPGGSSRGGQLVAKQQPQQQQQQQQAKREGRAGGLRALAAAGAAREYLLQQQQQEGGGWWDLWGLLQLFRGRDEAEKALALARRR
jgi:hypothetical protein